MFTKKESREELKRLRKEVSSQLWHLRRDRGLEIKEVAVLSKIPVQIVESLELFGLMNVHINDLQRLAGFYGRYVKVKLLTQEEFLAQEKSK